MSLYHFPATHRFNRHLARLIKGSNNVRSLIEDGKIVTAEKRYNRLCMDYAECRVLLKRRAEEIEKRNQFAEGVQEMIKIRAAFTEFYSLANSFKVDITKQREEAMRILDEIENLFSTKLECNAVKT